MHTESVSMCVRDQVMAKVQKRQRIITVAFHYQNFALYISEQNLNKTNKITTLKKQEKNGDINEWMTSMNHCIVLRVILRLLNK